MMNANILIVQDDNSAATDLAECLQGLGYAVCGAAAGQPAIEQAAAMRPDLALIDLELAGDVNGIEAAQQIGRFGVPVIFLTDGVEENLLQRAEATTPFGYVLKPFAERQLHLNIQTALSMRQRERRQQETEGRLERTIGELQAQLQLLQTIFDSISDGVIAADENGNYLIYNSRAEQIVNHSIPDIELEQRPKEYGLFYSDRKTLFPANELPLARALRGEATDDIEMFVRNRARPEGVYISVSGRLMPLGADGKQGAVVVFRDITQLKQAEAELQKTVAELQDQTRLMETVFNSMNEGVVATDENGKYLFCNASAQRIGGVHRPIKKTDQWSEKYGVFYQDSETLLPAAESPLVRAIRGEETNNIELFVRNEHQPDGVYISVNGRPLMQEEGVSKGGVIVVRDMTQDKEKEAKLQQTIHELQRQTNLMKTVFNSISDGVIAADGSGKFTIFNSSAKRIVGIGMLEIPPEQWSNRYGAFFSDQKTSVPTSELPLVRTLRGESVDEMELFIRNEEKPDGGYISVSGRPLKDDTDADRGGVVVFRDITMQKQANAELKQTMEELRAQSELLETTFNSISDGIIVADLLSESIHINPSAEQITGIDELESSPLKWAKKHGLFYMDQKTPVKARDLPLFRVVCRGETLNEEALFVRNEKKPDGVYIRLNGYPLLNEDGKIRGGVLFFRDVTEQQVSKEALERAFAQGRLEIVETILHNIGNAINSVTTGIETIHQSMVNDRLVRRLSMLADAVRAHQDDWTDYIQNDPQGQQVMPFIIALAEDFTKQNETLAKASVRVQERANHIADIVRTQRALGSTSMDRKDINLQQAFSDAIRVLQDSLDKRGIKIDVDCENAPQEIRIQESQFHQMMVNLLKNSLEAIDDLAALGGLVKTPHIQIRAYLEEDFFHLHVSDNGIGIEPKNAERIFSSGYTTKKSGSGLGLHSVANFVIGLGGEIRPLSDGTGKGMTMCIMLRHSSVIPPLMGGGGGKSLFLRQLHQYGGRTQPPGRMIELMNHVNRRVLIVDDQKEIHNDFTEMLKPDLAERSTDDLVAAFGTEEKPFFLPDFELLHAMSGEEACRIIEAGVQANRPIAVAYIDIRMPPGIDGIETIRRMRKINRDIEIVIMTAYTDKSLPEIIEDMELLHKVIYIRKPFAHEEIQQLTLSLVGKWNVEQELAEKQRQLAASYQRLEAVLNATDAAMAMYDAAGHLVFANRGYEQMLGLSASELKNISPDGFMARFKERFREPSLLDVEGRFVFEDRDNVLEETTAGQIAKQRLFYRSTAPVCDSRGDVIGNLYVYRDVSKEIEVEQMKAEVLRLRTELETTYSFDGLVGTSSLMQQVYALMKQAAESDITVLIRGESGTGKELVAKSFHFNSSRKEGPFLALNCAAIPETLIESELFGHEKGAFTGATKRSLGAFERTKGGTILLDEIGDMKLALQTKLLRVLQEREIQRVGGTVTIPVDVRVIAATNKNLEDAVKAGEFREDLFYRITAFPILIPPLRKRREDIPVLAKYFLEKHTASSDKSISGISTAALRLLLQYDWPGNVRELENAIERAILLETTDVLQANNLPPQLLPIRASQNDPSVPTTVLPLVEVERQALIHALKVSANNVTQAAQALGISRATLYRKLKKYNLLTAP